MPVPKSEFISDVWKDGIFANKVLFCTGGNGSICSAQVRAFVYLGGNACILGRNVEKTETVAKDIATVRAGAKVLGLGAIDVRNPEALRKAAETCAKELGGIDFVIAGAAGNFLAPMSQLSPNAFKAVIDIDVLGSFNTAKATLPYLVESAKKYKSVGKTSNPLGTGGRIIFISTTIHYTSVPLQVHVGVAKAGVDSLASSIGIEYGPLGLTSNVIAPGGIANTEGLERLSSQKDRDGMNGTVPLQRPGYVREIADASTWLFSEAAGYVNCSTVVVDGGAWRVFGSNPGSEFAYPEFLLSGEVVSGVKGGKKTTTAATTEKSKL